MVVERWKEGWKEERKVGRKEGRVRVREGRREGRRGGRLMDRGWMSKSLEGPLSPRASSFRSSNVQNTVLSLPLPARDKLLGR